MLKPQLSQPHPNFQFDRDKKPKYGEGTLEEALASMNPTEFNDEALLRLSGLKWTDFIEFANGDRQGGVLFWNHHSATLTVQTRFVEASDYANPDLIVSIRYDRDLHNRFFDLGHQW
jgi:hypothetical protein